VLLFSFLSFPPENRRNDGGTDSISSYYKRNSSSTRRSNLTSRLGELSDLSGEVADVFVERLVCEKGRKRRQKRRKRV
jgi:hypothetical protein